MRRPNFILLVGEDTGLHLGCYGQSYASTPNLDRLAQRGARYTHAIGTAPVSSPSRSSLITGKYPWSIGTHHHRSRLLCPPRLFTHELRAAGYHVNWANKTDFNFDPPADFTDPPHDWLPELGQGRLPDGPFFLFHNFGVTHESTMWRTDPHWAACIERIEQRHRLAAHQHHDPDHAPVPAYLADVPEVRGDIARYFDALSIQDAQVGDVLSALERSPYRENTCVIYMTDHGRGLLREKRWCYEAGLHLPLLLAGPGIVAGTVSDQLVNWVDIAPTILSLAGVAIPGDYQGRALLGEQVGPAREYAFAGRGRMDETYDCVRAARDRRFLYLGNDSPQLPYAQPNLYEQIQLTTQVMRELHARELLRGSADVWFSPSKPAEELYDIQADPDNVRNLAADPRYVQDLARMRAALATHLAEVGDLGAVPERELIARGLVADVLADMDQRRQPLHELFAIGGRRACELEMPPENRRA